MNNLERKEAKMRLIIRVISVLIVSYLLAYLFLYLIEQIVICIDFSVFPFIDKIEEFTRKVNNEIREIIDGNFIFEAIIGTTILLIIFVKKFFFKAVIFTIAWAIIRARVQGKIIDKVIREIGKTEKRKRILIASIVYYQIISTKYEKYKEEEKFLKVALIQKNRKRLLSKIARFIQPKKEGWINRYISRVVILGLFFASIFIPKTTIWLLHYDFVQNQIVKQGGRSIFIKIDSAFIKIVEFPLIKDFLWLVEKILLISIDTPKDFIKKKIWRSILKIRNRLKLYFKRNSP